MKKLCMFVVTIFIVTTVLSSFGMTALAASWYDSYTVGFSANGSMTLNSNDSGSGLKFTCGEPLPQKIDDKGYYWSGTPVDISGDSHGKTFINTSAPNAVKKYVAEKGSNPKYIAVDFDALFEFSGNAIGFRGLQTGASNTTFFRVTGGTDVPVKQWVHITAMIGADGSTNTVRVYVNGAEIPGLAKSTTAGASGFASFGWLIPYGKANDDFGLYVDNVRLLLGNDEYVNPYTIPEVASIETYNLNKETKTIDVYKNTTVEQLLGSIECTSGATANVINDDMNVVSGSTQIKNSYKLVVSCDNIFNYYELSYDADKLLMGINGSSYTANSGSNPLTIKPMINNVFASASFTVNSKAPQKADSDTAIKAYSSSPEANVGPGSVYLLSMIDKQIGKNKYKYVTFEYDVYISNENTGTFLRFKQYVDDSTPSKTMNVYVGSGTNDMTANADNIATVTSLEADKWYKVAMVIGADGENNECQIYVNDALAASVTKPTGLYGIATAAPNGYFSIAANKGCTFETYLDNINLYAGNVGYTPGAEAQLTDTESDKFTFDSTEKTIVPTDRKLTVGDFAKAINKTENTQAVYALTNIKTQAPSEEVLLCNCDYVVAVSTDGIWNYYTVNSDLKTDYHGLTIDLLYTYVDNAETLRVYTDVNNPLKNIDVPVTTIICFYDENNKLIGINAQNDATTENANEMFTKDASIPANATSFRILAWSDLTSLIPLTSTDKINISDRLFFILKFDDLMFNASSTSKYDQWLSYIDEYGVHATGGAIAQLFDEADLSVAANAQRAETMKKWIANGHEIWCHGYTTNLELDDTHSETEMIETLDKCFAAIKRVLDYDMHSYGSPGNAYSPTGCKVLNEYEPIKSVFMVKGANQSLMEKPDFERIIISEKVVDGGTRVLADYFKTNFATTTSKRVLDDYAITQIHPTWKNDDDLANFKEMFKFMLTQNVCFMTPSEYTDYINNK